MHGITVNGRASTPYNVAVGGTDFSDTYSGTTSTYWNSTNTSSNGSAKSYIPEIPWNTTCGSQLFATFEGSSTTYGSSGFCNSSFISNNIFYLNDWGGKRRSERLCDRGDLNLWRCQRHLCGIREALLADRLGR